MSKVKKLSTAAKQKRHRYNWLPDLPDHRDFIYTEKVVAPLSLPQLVDLRPQCSPVFDQKQIGSCTANALAGAMEFLELGELRQKNQSAEVFGAEFAALSRLFIYYNERVIEGTTTQDAGAMLRDGVKSLCDRGVCREILWKYATANVFKKPVAKAYAEGAKHCISSYLRLLSLNDMRQCLASGFPFVFGFSVYESFESPAVARTGVMSMPDSSERLLGGHAVMAVGYDDAKKRLVVRNSWGSQW